MYLSPTLILLFSVVSLAQKVTELYPCLTKENNLRMDCKYEVSSPSPNPVCNFTQDSKLMGSTDPSAQPDSTFKNRVNVSLTGSSMCRLYLTGLSDDKAYNYICMISQSGKSTNMSRTVGKRDLQTCSAISVLFQAVPTMLLCVMSFPLLLELSV
ncbi:thy-1 membrane glycoprotein [Lepisosteus oculatus]|uniref:thy-1 membrane glycoprotein n=1 Tax=Lepisosteus oculatus TaxID=7918 RepID=UPI0037141CF4